MPASDALSPLRDLPPRCLLGVSGGIDSVALLHAMVAAGKRPVVVHFNHGWRTESTAEAKFVEKLARQSRLRFLSARAAKTLPRTEQSARTARWAFFEKVARQAGCRDLVLAHHADDQVETFLLQLLRGGGSGARGMQALSRRGTLAVHRPWLGVWRREIAAYARKHRLKWCEDPSNRDVKLTRNRLRHRLIPYLQKYFSKEAPRALWRAAEILGAEADWLDALMVKHRPTARLSVKSLRALPVAETRRILRRWLAERGIVDIGFEDIEAVRGLLIHRLPAKVNLSGGRFARRKEGQLFVE